MSGNKKLRLFIVKCKTCGVLSRPCSEEQAYCEVELHNVSHPKHSQRVSVYMLPETVLDVENLEKVEVAPPVEPVNPQDDPKRYDPFTF
ncbi:hypothetical protein B9G54_01660 [Alloscardovia macacae]|uniref:Uncharacterized protein n=1 Tax=Alloscardovia macacae TaxID=1160091 RepID=A0A1Y2T1W9_9BIFI|nr:hypothetical protein [Alloscardovia macacae]OTA27252.1 hypothetical protein B9G54_01660 [Alloscardovia macacae]OTA29262.1 hypothetical protein B9T39_03855 [Alloscardovia macacae]